MLSQNMCYGDELAVLYVVYASGTEQIYHVICIFWFVFVLKHFDDAVLFTPFEYFQWNLNQNKAVFIEKS